MSAVDESLDCSTACQRTDEHFLERRASFLRRANEGPIDLLFLGDSITRRWMEVPVLWNRYFGMYRPANYGIGGDTTQSMLWRVRNGDLENIAPRVAVLLAGTNNAPAKSGMEIARAIQQVVQTVRHALPGCRVLLLAIFPRGPQSPVRGAPDPYYMDRIIDANAYLSRLEDGTSIRYLDIGSRFLEPGGEIDTTLMPDRLHLVEPGYVVWGESMSPLLGEMMSSGDCTGRQARR